MINKRGLSPVIATVLLVVLTITAVVIVSQFIIPFVRDKPAESTECIPYQEYFTFEEKFVTSQGEKQYNCYDNNGLHGISVRANTINKQKAIEVVGFDSIFIREDSSLTANARQDAPAGRNEGGLRMLKVSTGNIKIPKEGEVQTYVFNATKGEVYKEVEIHPVLSNGRTCPTSDSITLIPCQVSLEVS